MGIQCAYCLMNGQKIRPALYMIRSANGNACTLSCGMHASMLIQTGLAWSRDGRSTLVEPVPGRES